MKRLVSTFFLGSTLVACAAGERKQAASPASAAEAAPAADAPQGGYPQQNQYAPPPPQASGAPQPEPAKPSATPATPPSPGTATSRAMAVQNASSDVDSAQRELDVAGSSCQNACRALGSMDRAAGHLCQLTREDNTHDRCDDAKRRLFNARDRVRNTCGACPDNQPATDRNAPVPSMR